MRHVLLLSPVVALLASGCFVSRGTTNEPLVRARIDELAPGRSTAAQAVESLGAPSEIVQLGERSAYRYDYTVAKQAGLTLIVITFLNNDTRQDRAWLFFDERSVLTHVGATLEADDTEYALPWMEIHDD